MIGRFATETERLEAFSDGVLAVIITIMVLDLRAPRETTFAALAADAPTFLAYVLSFIFVGIYWNNHHHMLRASMGINGAAMWANLHLLFWLSLVPFTTMWMGQNPRATVPTVLYGVVLFGCAIAYTILQHVLYRLNGAGSPFAEGDEQQRQRSALARALLATAILLAFWLPLISDAIFIVIAIVWPSVPDRRFEPAIALRRSGVPLD